MVKQLDFKNKHIFITGASVGIGKETAIQLSKSGAKVTLLDISEEGLKETTSILEGSGHHFFQYDLSDLEGIEQKVKEIVSICGPFDGFVQCVGIRSRRPVSLLTPKVLSSVMSVNFGSFIELVRCITKKNHFNEGLSIVGISSISSQRGGASVTAYAASKSAMDSAVRCLAKELAPKKIRLNTVLPSQINTPAYADLLKMNGDTEDLTLSRQYLGLGEANDVANAIVFLLSNNSRFITGTAIPVDGGFLSS
jgi:NAD(P)-dependent dehydrogenase (short-subunit alcohol dehydrogenase family)